MNPDFEKLKLSILERKNVVAVGLGDNTIEVSVAQKEPEANLAAKDIVPKSADGMPTNVTQTGVIRALSYTGRYRPAPGGVSVGHMNITAGTLGIWIKVDGKWCILSNNHVLAFMNDGVIGDPILQPGVYDGGTISDKIAELKAFVPIEWAIPNDDDDDSCPFASGVASILNKGAEFIGSRYRLKPYRTFSLAEQPLNLVDCAIAQAIDDSVVQDEILNIGKVAGISEGFVQLPVIKTGRTTEYTSGTITQTDATVGVNYGGTKGAYFTDQLVTGPMIQGGDSGSLLVNLTDKTAVGLCFAGSSSLGIHNRIQNVLEALQITI